MRNSPLRSSPPQARRNGSRENRVATANNLSSHTS
jgi:hypothetical protein